MALNSQYGLARLLGVTAQVAPHERKAAILAFFCNFALLGSYYILRPLRDTMGTVFGVADLQNLFTGTFVIIFLAAPLFSWCAAKVTLSRLLPGVFWFLLANLLIFYLLFHLAPNNRWVAGAYFCWFSAINLILISVFWTLMADTFSAAQATRFFAFIAAGGSLGAIMGPVITTSLVQSLGIDGLLLIAIAGFLLVILLVHLLMREKQRLREEGFDAQNTTLDHSLPGNPFRGFELLLKSAFMMGQAAFMLLMTWIATILYFLQADLISRAYSAVELRAVAFADVDLFVNICSAAILILGLSRVMRRFGVTASLVLSPILMVGACLALIAAPTLFMVQTARALQRISQYAIARPSREVLFTVIDQQSKYKAKNVIDTVVYRFGDLTAAWMQAGLRAGGFGLAGAVVLGVGVSTAWGFVAFALGRRYEALSGARPAEPAVTLAE
ncbi:MAG TPA: MFS transporter [Rhizomicrobium sp.]|jgi:AAA family ATP:ADP antiporter|nr:MFS transporter [Rhizomicrobium sp.]